MGLHGRQAWVLVYTRCLGYSIDDFGWYLAFSEDWEFPEISPSTRPWNSTLRDGQQIVPNFGDIGQKRCLFELTLGKSSTPTRVRNSSSKT